MNESRKTLVKTIVSAMLGSILLLDLSAQNTPISQSANSMVNLLTGGFKYSMPVVEVSGPNGENVPVTFNYSGGITTEQQASWIGLGWNYNPGEITRSTKGVADDWKNKLVSTTTRTISAITADDSYMYGPIYFKDIDFNSATKSMDVVSSTARTTGLFQCPDYDVFHVSGPGISGTMEARLFDYAAIHMKSGIGYTYNDGYSSSVDGEEVYTKTPSFIFTDDVHSNVYSNGSMVYLNDDFPGSFTKPYTASGDYSGAYNSTDNRAHTSYYVEYFTNAAINSGVSGFLDFRIVSSGPKRPTSEFESDGIGAYRITLPSGLVYHYSLPVYSFDESTKIFVLTSSYGIDNADEYKTIDKADRYASSWKLTAVTGADYSDANSNGVVDIGDSGYWVGYNYGKWTDNHEWRYPYFNYKQGRFNKKLPSGWVSPSFQQIRIFKQDGTISSGIYQEYYLNNIQTGTQTAYFIKSVRLDDHSLDLVPRLRLDKVVLLNNEDISLLENSASLSYDSRFVMTSCLPANVKPHIGNYNSNEMLIKSKALQTVELSYDYGLCKMSYNNINNSFTTTNQTFHFNPTSTDFVVYNKFDEVSGSKSTTDNNNSGKLTLNEIKILGFGYKAAGPSYLFDYDKGSSTKNPNYSVFKTDWWGYNKSDFSYSYRGRHTTEASMVNTDAWSMKKITTPLGGEILIDYESNRYRKVHDGTNYVSPVRYFLIGSVNFAGWTATTNLEAESFRGKDSVIQEKVIIPHSVFGYNGGSPCAIEVMGAVGVNSIISNSNADPITTYTMTGLSGLDYASLHPTCNTGLVRTYSPSTTYSGAPMGWGYFAFTYSSIQGAGCRVKSISFKDTETANSYANEYTYELGSAGTEPVDIAVTNETFIETNKKSSDPFLPSPGITYGKVTVKSKSLNNAYAGRVVYEYNNTYDPIVTHQAEEDDIIYTTGPTRMTKRYNYHLIKTNGLFCSPKQTTVYDNNNNILSKSVYEYVSGNTLPGLRECFYNVFVLPSTYMGSACDFLPMTNYTKEERTARLLRVTEYKDGIKTITENLAWDGITGEVTKIRTIDPTNGVTIVTTTPAFRATGYSSMGAKSVSSSNQNLLLNPYKITTERDKLTRDVNNQLQPAGSPVLVSGKKTTWQQNYPSRVYDGTAGKYITQTITSSLWKPYKTFTYNGNSSDASWREDDEVTIFNKRNQIIETKSGVANRYSSVKYGYDQKFVLCQAADCKYTDFSYSGFEDQESTNSWQVCFGGEFSQGTMRYAGNGVIMPHTGKYMAKVEPSEFGPLHAAKGYTKGRSYRATVWVHKNSTNSATLVFTLDGSVSGSPASVYKAISKSDASNITVGDWVQMTLTMDVPANFTESGGTYGSNDLVAYVYNPGSTTAYFDDIMVRPVDAEINGSVVDEKTGQELATLDMNDFATKYVYDDAGRLREVWTESPTDGWKLKKRYSYNFKRTY